MSQYDFGTIDASTKNGTALASDLNSWRTAVHSGHAGSSRPSYVVAGMQWINNSTNPWVLNLYDGADDIPIGTFDTTTNVYTPSGTLPIASGGTGSTTAATARTALGAQAALVSGTSIKTINSTSLLGSGDIVIGVTDGDKGDITVSSSGTVWTVDQKLTLATKQPLSSGPISFTSIPTWVKRITVMIRGVSLTTGTSTVSIRIGSGGVVLTTGYDQVKTIYAATPGITHTAVTTDLLNMGFSTAGSSGDFVATLTRFDGNEWMATLIGYRSIDAFSETAISYVSLPGPLDILSIEPNTTFDSGSVNILYEG